MTADQVLDWLRASATPEIRKDMARYGIPDSHALGVAMGQMKRQAKALGPNHDVALDLWKTGVYEARVMAIFLADPTRLDPDLMDRWCADFDNWAICDTACFHLFDRTPHAWGKVSAWAPSEREFVRRAGFALIWSLTTHDKTSADRAFVDVLSLIEAHAGDDRPLVRKAIDMALRAIGKRNADLNAAARTTARRLAKREDKSAAWIGRHALRELESDKVQARLARR